MTDEEKQLLLIDLCARLPYDTIISVNDGKYRRDVKLHPHYIFDWDAERWDVKPYLRPMSSMTVEECEELEQIAKETLGDFMFEAEEDGGAIYHMYKWKTLSPAMFDYLNSIHIDYRGLIEMGLALEAPEGMYNN